MSFDIGDFVEIDLCKLGVILRYLVYRTLGYWQLVTVVVVLGEDG